MKTFLYLFLLFAGTPLFSQTYQFKPSWKVGAEKEIYIEREDKEYEKNELISSETTDLIAFVKITGENNTHYTLQMDLQNVVMKEVQKMYDLLNEEIEEYENVHLEYKIDKNTGIAQLTNWKETNKFLETSIKDLTKVLKKKDKELGSMISLIFLPIEEMMKSQETMEGYFSTYIDPILVPFNKTFELNKPLTVISGSSNPFSAQDSLHLTQIFTLKSFDESNQTGQMVELVELDLSEFTKMFKSMMEKMFKSIGLEEDKLKEKLAEVEQFKMENITEKNYEFNARTGWVTQMDLQQEISNFDPNKNIEKKKVITVKMTIR